MGRTRGIVLFSALVISVLAMMMVAALVQLARQDLGNGAGYRDHVRALEMARGGLNHICHRWTYDQGFAQNVTVELDDESYFISFEPADPFHSVNNLVGLQPSTTLDFRGRPVPGKEADVIVRGRAGRSEVRLRARVTRGLTTSRSVGAVGRVRLGGDCTLDGIASLADPQHTGGGVFSLHRANGANGASIEIVGGGAFDMQGETRLEVPPPASGADAVSNLPSAFADRVVQNTAPPEVIPELDINRMVSSKSACPAPPGLFQNGGVNYSGHQNLKDDRYVNGALVVNGDLVLSSGSLYVSGKLTVNGGVMGVGSVFAGGDVAIQGGTSVLDTNQGSGAAVFAGGDVKLEGLDALGYLDNLGAAHPEIATAKRKLTTTFTQMQDLANTAASAHDPTSALNQFWGTSGNLYAPWNGGDYWANPIPGAGGLHGLAGGAGNLPELTRAIKDNLGPAYATDQRAQKIVRASEEIMFQYRRLAQCNRNENPDSDYKMPGVTGPIDNYVAWMWDDISLLPVADQHTMSMTGGPWTRIPVGTADSELVQNAPYFFQLGIDHQFRALFGSSGVPMIEQCPERDALIRGMAQRYKAWFTHHPLDFSWLGHSRFQGLIYAHGNVRVQNRFDVVGAVMSQGQVDILGGSTLVYDDEYFRQRGSLGPLTFLQLEQL